MTKKRILAIGILVAVISVTGIIVYNTNRNEADTVETIAHIETDEATTSPPPTPVEEDKKVEDNTSVYNTTTVKEDNESIETEETTPTDNTTPTKDTTPVDDTNTTETEDTTEIKEDTVDSDITPLDKTMYAQGNVNTRSGPSQEFEKVGGLSVNQSVHVIGQSKTTQWYAIEVEVDGSVETQYVSNKFLSDTKITVTTSTDISGTTGTTGSTDSTDSTGSGGNTGGTGNASYADSDGDAATLFQNGYIGTSDGWDQGDFSSGAGIKAE